MQDVFDAVLGVNPLGWLPSFVPVTPDWWIGAYLRLAPAVAIAAILIVLGARYGRRAHGPNENEAT